MSEQRPVKIRLSTLLLILAIIVIIVMAYFVNKILDEKDKEISRLNSEIITLQSSINGLNGRMDMLSNTISSGLINQEDIQLDVDKNNQ